MKDIKEAYNSLGLDGMIFALSSLGAIVFGVMSFIGVIPFAGDQLSSILIGATGVLMAAVVALSTSRKSEINELRNTLGVSDSKILKSHKELEESLAFSATKAESYISDTSLSRMIPEPASLPFFSGVESAYRRTIFDRVRRREIRFKRVEIIFHRQGLEQLLFRLLLHQGYDYQIRHYEPLQKPIPMLSFVSFDDTTFYFGGYYLQGASREDKSLLIREPNLAQLFSDYWDTRIRSGGS